MDPLIKRTGRILSIGPTVRNLNPEIFSHVPVAGGTIEVRAIGNHLVESNEMVEGKRIRQSPKPLMNKLETEAYLFLSLMFPKTTIRPQAKRYRLANGLTYTPDFTAIFDGHELAWEVKGKAPLQDDSVVKIKCAAAFWPEVDWFLLWKGKEGWATQKVLP